MDSEVLLKNTGEVKIYLLNRISDIPVMRVKAHLQASKDISEVKFWLTISKLLSRLQKTSLVILVTLNLDVFLSLL